MCIDHTETSNENIVVNIASKNNINDTKTSIGTIGNLWDGAKEILEIRVPNNTKKSNNNSIKKSDGLCCLTGTNTNWGLD